MTIENVLDAQAEDPRLSTKSDTYACRSAGPIIPFLSGVFGSAYVGTQSDVRVAQMGMSYNAEDRTLLLVVKNGHGEHAILLHDEGFIRYGDIKSGYDTSYSTKTRAMWVQNDEPYYSNESHMRTVVPLQPTHLIVVHTLETMFGFEVDNVTLSLSGGRAHIPANRYLTTNNEQWNNHGICGRIGNRSDGRSDRARSSLSLLTNRSAAEEIEPFTMEDFIGEHIVLRNVEEWLSVIMTKCGRAKARDTGLQGLCVIQVNRERGVQAFGIDCDGTLREKAIPTKLPVFDGEVIWNCSGDGTDEQINVAQIMIPYDEYFRRYKGKDSGLWSVKTEDIGDLIIDLTSIDLIIPISHGQTPGVMFHYEEHYEERTVSGKVYHRFPKPGRHEPFIEPRNSDGDLVSNWSRGQRASSTRQRTRTQPVVEVEERPPPESTFDFDSIQDEIERECLMTLRDIWVACDGHLSNYPDQPSGWYACHVIACTGSGNLPNADLVNAYRSYSSQS